MIPYQVGFSLSVFLLCLTGRYMVNIANTLNQKMGTIEAEKVYQQRRFCLNLWFLLSLGMVCILFPLAFQPAHPFAFIFFIFSLFAILFLVFFMKASDSEKIPFSIIHNLMDSAAYPLWLVHTRIQQSGEKESKRLDLELVLEQGDNEPTVQDQQMYRGIVKFSATNVYQIMTPKNSMVMVDHNSDLDQVLALVNEKAYSRIPVYDRTENTFLGTLHAKDLLALIDSENSDWHPLIRPAYYVSESEKIIDLLEHFQQQKIHLALVTDDLGKNTGLITLEDVIEEIVGDISDEFDEEEITYSKLDTLNYIFEAKTQLEDLKRILSLDSDFFERQPENQTINGFLRTQMDHPPAKGDQIDYKILSFKLESVDKRKVKRVKITITS